MPAFATRLFYNTDQHTTYSMGYKCPEGFSKKITCLSGSVLATFKGFPEKFWTCDSCRPLV